jgi:hypothetical protein
MTEQILPFLSLLATIIGWFLSYRYQKRILERQIQAENERKNHDIVFTQRIEQLNEIKLWLQNGERLWRMRKIQKGKESELTKNFVEWKSSLGKIRTLVAIIDREFPVPTAMEHFGWFGVTTLFIVTAIRSLFVGDEALEELQKFSKSRLKPSLAELVEDFFSLTNTKTNENDDESEEGISKVYGQALSHIDVIATNRLLVKKA